MNALDPESIDEAFVQRASSLHGVRITAQQMPGVIDNLRRTARIAATVNEFPLDPVIDEPGPLWRL